MKKLIFGVIFALLLATNAYASELKELIKLVQQEITLLEKSKKKGDEIHYRLFELYSERLKIVFQFENKIFLKANDPAKHNNRKKYFIKSQELYRQSQNYGMNILKLYPKTPRIADIYYTLALNARDYDQGKNAEPWLLKSLSLAKNPSLIHHARSSLGDHYYNDKKYELAVSYYEKTLSNLDDEWLPKNYLNLGWCYLKTNQMDRAINSLKKAQDLSQDSRYIDIQDQVLNALVPFWVMSGKIDEGINYFLKEANDPFEFLLHLGKKASDKGYVAETERCIDKIESLPTYRKDIVRQEEVINFKLKFFKDAKRWDRHLQATIEAKSFYLSPLKAQEKARLVSFEDSLENIKAVAGYHQLSLTKNSTKVSTDFNERDAQRVKAYFSILQLLDPSKKAQYLYFIAESSYAIKKHKEALGFYTQALKETKIKKNDELTKKIISSLLLLSEEEPFTPEENKAVLAFTYQSQVEFFPVDNLSHSIYPKLAQLQLNRGKLDQVVPVLTIYNKSYPNDLKEQQNIMKQLLNIFIEKKNDVSLNHWVGELKKGFLRFARTDVEKLELVLADILFFRGFELKKAGKDKEAFAIFEGVFKKTDVPPKIRSLSAYHAADLLINTNKKTEAINWLEKAIVIDSDAEIQARGQDWIRLLDRLTFLNEMRGGVRLFDQMLTKTCHYRTKVQDDLLARSVNFHLVLMDDWLSKENLQGRRKCLSSDKVFEGIIDSMMSYYAEHNEPNKLIATFNMSTHKPRQKFAYELKDLFWDNPRKQAAILEELKKFKDISGVSSFITAENLSSQFSVKSKEILSIQIKGLEPFDEALFGQSLNDFLGSIQKFISQNQEMLTVDDQILRTGAASEIKIFYQAISEKINGLKISGDPDFVASFKGEMKKIAASYESEVKLLDKKARGPASTPVASPLEPALTTLSLDKHLTQGGQK